MSQIHEILEKIDDIEFMNKNAHLRNRKDTRPLLTTQITDNTKLSIHDQNHPMNLSVSSLNSLTKSRDSRIGASMTQNNDIKWEKSPTIKNKNTHFRSKALKKSYSPLGKHILGRKPTFMKQQSNYLSFWSAKTSKRIQMNHNKSSALLRKRKSSKINKGRWNTKILINVLDEFNQEGEEDELNQW